MRPAFTAISELLLLPLLSEKLFTCYFRKLAGMWGLDAEMAYGLLLNHGGSAHSVEVAEPVLTLASWSPWRTWAGHWMATKTWSCWSQCHIPIVLCEL